MDNTTLNYYNANAQDFVQGTVAVDFHITQDRFLAQLEDGASILDFGCGSGRDTKYFLQRGFKVEATDGSAELCKLASEYTGISVKQMLFDELEEVAKYDGIWACASILHLAWEDLVDVMRKMVRAVKGEGVIYTSFKYGKFSGERNGRFFTDLDEEGLAKLLQEVGGLEVKELWITGDVRPGRGEEKWLNVLLKKSCNGK
ncbi:MAG: class I SAM-dependent methyltransferase [Phascolarctobacterium sp.]